MVCFQAKYEATKKLSSAEAKAGMLSAVRAMVFGVRGEIYLASERLERAVEQGEEAQHSTAQHSDSSDIMTGVGLLGLAIINQCDAHAAVPCAAVRFGIALPSVLDCILQCT